MQLELLTNAFGKRAKPRSARSFLAAIGCAAFVTGCATPPGGSEPASLASIPPAGAGTDPSAVTAGRQVYVLKCARCHKFYDPAQYTEAEWQDWMSKMSHKARLSREQDALVSDYLATFRRK